MSASPAPSAPSASRTPRVLAIAGSDSGGGAGIQADLKAFASCGVHGMTAITAITAQSTVGVDAVQPVEPAVILAQVRSVVDDIGVDAVKVGMLGSAETARAVARALNTLPRDTPIVVDPVMVSESGARLLDEDAVRVLIEDILPRATVITPNLPEAQALDAAAPHPSDRPASPAAHHDTTADRPPSDNPPQNDSDIENLARRLHALGPAVVVITGGHRERAIDVYFDGQRVVDIAGERHPGGAAHGSGCTHSSVLAAQLALGRSPLDAARAARVAAGAAVAAGLQDVGRGPGPVDVLGLATIRAGGGIGDPRHTPGPPSEGQRPA